MSHLFHFPFIPTVCHYKTDLVSHDWNHNCLILLFPEIPFSLETVCGSRQAVLGHVAKREIVIRLIQFKPLICSNETRSPVHSHSALYPFCVQWFIEDPLVATITATVTALGTVTCEKCITVTVIIGRDLTVYELLATVRKRDTTEAYPHVLSRSVTIPKAIT